jgi:hypothetical protein
MSRKRSGPQRPKKKLIRKERNRRQQRRPVVQLRDRLEGNCPECGSAVSVRQIENFPNPIQGALVNYKLSFCNYCAWNNVELDVRCKRELSEGELAQLHQAVMDRLQVEVNAYADFQQKLSTLPFGMATSVIGAALGFDGAELSVARQVIDKGVSLDVAYGELCQALKNEPNAAVAFRTLAEIPQGHAALWESVKYWRDKGLIPPWKELVEPFLRGSDLQGGYEAL